MTGESGLPAVILAPLHSSILRPLAFVTNGLPNGPENPGAPVSMMTLGPTFAAPFAAGSTVLPNTAIVSPGLAMNTASDRLEQHFPAAPAPGHTFGVAPGGMQAPQPPAGR